MTDEAVRHIRQHLDALPRAAVVLGTGLGGFVSELIGPVEIPYASIPGWPASTVTGHAGKLVIGSIAGQVVAVAAGRAHLYEGYSAAEVSFGVRVLARLGVRKLVLTNAAGGIREGFGTGDLVLISDHINLQGVSPLGGPEFVDLTEAYSAAWRRAAREAARTLDFNLPEGVYAAVRGPNYETPAEIRYLRTIGADLVGMSTVEEVIAARAEGMDVLGISCVTNPAAGLGDREIDPAEVEEVGKRATARLVALLEAVLRQL
ncbi:MAG: purine-nucleoside phosphorylase [bacterium]|nr:purine-nucleoside phosphorylase [bacterium]